MFFVGFLGALVWFRSAAKVVFVADHLAELMRLLGYEHYGCQLGEVGFFVLYFS